MGKFKGISRVIKGTTTHFQEYFWKTVVTLLYINKISSNFSHLFQDIFCSMQHSKEVSIIFLKSVRNLEKKKDICVDLIFVSFTNFKGIPGFYTKFQAISRVQGAKINSRLFKGFKEPWEPCHTNHTNQLYSIMSVNKTDLQPKLLIHRPGPAYKY